MSDEKFQSLYDKLAAELGVMTEGKRSVLLKYVEVSIAFDEIASQIAREGRTVRAERGGMRAHPLMSYYRSLAGEARGYATILGLTKDNGPPADDDFGEFMGAE